MAITRRQFIAGGTTLAAGLALSNLVRAGGVGHVLQYFKEANAAPVVDRVDDYTMFPSSVASGDPTPSGCILWTRIAAEAFQPRQDVWFELAVKDDFKDVTARGRIPAGQVKPEAFHTIRVDTHGLLQADKWYHYRFIHDGVASKPGRLRTAPDADAEVEKLRFAVFSCSNFPEGHFNGYGLAAADGVDYVLHLGDFIYEYNTPEGLGGRNIVLPSGQTRMVSRADLDYVYSTYRSDKNLRLLLEQHTMMHIADDHEVANNRYYDYDEDRHHGDDGFPIDGDAAATQAYFLDAMRAYYQWMPVRIRLDEAAQEPLDFAEPYRRLRFGSLIDLFLLEGRWFRSKQPATESDATDITQASQADGTMLGKKQLGWFLDGLVRSKTTWRFIANQTLFVPLGAVLPLPQGNFYLNQDAWDGYRADRDAVSAALKAAGAKGNVIVTGDMHAFSAAYVQAHYGTQTEVLRDAVGVEFMIGGLTSAGLGSVVPVPPTGEVPATDEAIERAVLAANPHFKHFNWSRNGYSVLEFTKDRCTVEIYVVDKSTDNVSPSARLLMRKYNVPPGTPALELVEANSPSGLPVEPPLAGLHKERDRGLVVRMEPSSSLS